MKKFNILLLFFILYSSLLMAAEQQKSMLVAISTNVVATTDIQDVETKADNVLNLSTENVQEDLDLVENSG